MGPNQNEWFKFHQTHGVEIKDSPNEERPSCVFHISHPTQRPPQHQCRCHVTPRVNKQRASQGLETEKSKSVKGDRLGFQRTLVELILNVQATESEPSPSTMAIVPKPSRISLCRDHFGSVSAESNSASAEMSQYFRPQILRYFTSHRITIEHTVSLRKIDLGLTILQLALVI
ncbi:hypothetical protein CR513_03852, partial [Mucuna pruriens]